MVETKTEAELESPSLGSMRSRVDIMAAILGEALGDAGKTRIMYQCNLSHRQLQRYLELLLSMGLLRSFSRTDRREAELFETTRKGEAFLAAYRSLRDVMSSASMG